MSTTQTAANTQDSTIQTLKQQRDELLDALEDAARALLEAGKGNAHLHACAAIARAKEQQAN